MVERFNGERISIVGDKKVWKEFSNTVTKQNRLGFYCERKSMWDILSPFIIEYIKNNKIQ